MYHTRYDVIIIGSGVGGLVCGYYLQRNNPHLKTMIMEKNITPGGYVSGFKKDGLYFDSGAGCIMDIGPESDIYKRLKKLGFEHDLIKIDPFLVHLDKDLTFKFYCDYDELMDEVSRNFPDQANGFESLTDNIQSIAEKTLPKRDINRYRKTTTENFLNDHLNSKELKNILNMFCFFHGAEPKEVNTYSFAHKLNSVVQDGIYYPKGGMKTFSERLASFFTDCSGTISYNTKVNKIISENQRAKGVLLETGAVIKADWIVSNADLKRTVFKYLDHNELNVTYLKNIDKLRQSRTGVMLFLGIDKDLSEYPSQFQIGNGLDETNKVQKERFPMERLFIRIPTNLDTSLNSKGYSSLTASTFAPYDWNDFWKAGFKKRRERPYRQCKEEVMDEMIGKLKRVIPNIKKHIVFKDLATPLTFERCALTTEGSWFGPFKFQDLPYYKTPIENVFLTGSNVSGGGVADAIRSGLITAEFLTRNIQSSIRSDYRASDRPRRKIVQ